MRRSALAAVALVLSACSRGPAPPATTDGRNDACAFCHMTVSDLRLAAQIVAPGDEPRFFDDIGCLREFLASAKALPADAVAYVADHRTKAWVRAREAVYAQQPQVQTPMGSHLLAWKDAASRDADPLAAGASFRTAAQLFGKETP